MTNPATVVPNRQTFIKPKAVSRSAAPRGPAPRGNVAAPQKPVIPAPVSAAAQRAIDNMKALNSKPKPVNRQDQGQSRAEGNLQQLTEIKFLRTQKEAAERSAREAKGQVEALTNKVAGLERELEATKKAKVENDDRAAEKIGSLERLNAEKDAIINATNEAMAELLSMKK
jgi:predicted RNase H-like nuclease (RuvC/YqgF family)